MIWIVYLAIVILLVIYGIGVYNKLVKSKNLVEEGWSGIDVQLKKRYDLIPNLVETVKGYANHEKDTFLAVTNARNSAQAASSIDEQVVAEKQLNQSMLNLFAVAEQYPDLKANANFQNLQKELSNIENDIEKSRRYYNGTVRTKNIAVESFPSSIFAQIYGFHKSEYFEIENDNERNNPTISFE